MMRFSSTTSLLLLFLCSCCFFANIVPYANASASAVSSDIVLTSDQLQKGQLLMSELYNLKNIIGKCSFNDVQKNETCFIHVDEEINFRDIHKHIKFDAIVSAQIDLKQLAILVEANIDNKWIYRTKYSLQDFAQVCYPFFEVLKLCVDFTNIEFSVKNDCFVADMNINVRLLTMKLNLLTQHISYHQDRCRAPKLFGDN